MSAYECPVCGEGFDFGKSSCGYGDKCMHASRLANERAAEIKRLRAELSAIKDKVRELMAEMQSSRLCPTEVDAPGHKHTVPGRWDDTGAECRRCTLWREIKEALQ